MSVSVSVYLSVFLSVPVCVPVHVLFRVRVHVNLNTVWRYEYLSPTWQLCILSIPKGSTRWCKNLKGLSYERGLLKSAENLGASSFKRDLSIETTFSQTNLAGQSL
jgi:hypothetical protein